MGLAPPADFDSYEGRDQFVAEQYRSGKSLSECGEMVGVSKERIRQILDKLGVERRPRGSRKLLEAPVETVSAMAAQGYTTVEIARECGCSPYVVLRTISENGIVRGKKRYRPRPMSRVRCDPNTPTNKEIARLSSKGLSASEIGAEIGMSRNGVHGRMVACGIAPSSPAYGYKRVRNNPDDPTNRRIAHLLDNGEHPNEIARAMGLALTTVLQRIHLCNMIPSDGKVAD